MLLYVPHISPSSTVLLLLLDHTGRHEGCTDDQLELLYSPALYPSTSIPSDVARKLRQNFFTNAREVIRVTGGKGIILSSGPGGNGDGMRGPIDLINLYVHFHFSPNRGTELTRKGMCTGYACEFG